MDSFSEEVLGFITDEVYPVYQDNSLNIFLCGAHSADTESLRSIIYERIKEDSKFLITFPEWLFGDLVGASLDLLTLEKDLAEYVDLIILPLEGPGTFAELGAFASNSRLSNKILVINDEKYRNRPSFINDGPIKLIKKRKSDNVIYYQQKSKEEVGEQIHKKVRLMHKRATNSNLQNYFNFSNVLFFTISIFQPIPQKRLIRLLSELLPEETEKARVIQPSLEILSARGFIRAELTDDIQSYSLSLNGHQYLSDLLANRVKMKKKYFKFRTEYLYNRTKKTKYDFWEGKSKLLVAN